MKAQRRRLGFNWRGLVLPLVFLLSVELIAMASTIERDAFAAPSAVLAAAIRTLHSGAALRATSETLITAGSGLLLGFAIGLIGGIPLGLFRRADQLMMVPLESLRPVPPVALIPLSLLIFGFGYAMEIAVVAFAVIGPIFLMTRSAIRGIEPQLMEVSQALGLGLIARVTKIVLPAILPRIFVAFRIALGIALVVAVTVEITANPLGLGYAMTIAQQSLQPDLMFALLLWIGLTGWSLNALLLRAESRLFGAAA
jgi:ABC-type nitrate/sulfonate/bicarbonate transport system permease component